MTPETLKQLTVGAVVTLKSGGPAMTVAGWEDDTKSIAEHNAARDASPFAYCAELVLALDPRLVSVSVSWVSEDGTPRAANYVAAMLKPY